MTEGILTPIVHRPDIFALYVILHLATHMLQTTTFSATARSLLFASPKPYFGPGSTLGSGRNLPPPRECRAGNPGLGVKVVMSGFEKKVYLPTKMNI